MRVITISLYATLLTRLWNFCMITNISFHRSISITVISAFCCINLDQQFPKYVECPTGREICRDMAYIISGSSDTVRGTTWRSVSAEILSTAAKAYENRILKDLQQMSDLERHSRSLEMARFDRLRITSYKEIMYAKRWLCSLSLSFSFLVLLFICIY